MAPQKCPFILICGVSVTYCGKFTAIKRQPLRRKMEDYVTQFQNLYRSEEAFADSRLQGAPGAPRSIWLACACMTGPISTKPGDGARDWPMLKGVEMLALGSS
jgi:hypothetical protein